jgi:DNA-binding winged helix-turn-helix (wHTH) protein
MTAAPDPPFSVGRWDVDPASGCISHNGTSIRLEPRVMDVLVYLAARPGQVVTREELEAAIWAERVVGYDALTGTMQKLRKAFADDARQPRVVETLSKRGYRLVAPVGPPHTAAQLQRAGNRAFPRRALVVLADDLITVLAQQPELFVIARDSTFFYKDQAVDIRDIARRLGVRYVLHGSVRRTGERIRLNVQLIDTTSGTHLWAERYDGELSRCLQTPG